MAKCDCDELDRDVRNDQGYVAAMPDQKKMRYVIGTRIVGLVLDQEEIESLGAHLEKTYPVTSKRRWCIRTRRGTLYIWVQVPYKELRKDLMYRHACTFRSVLKRAGIMERAMICLIFR
jgi:hypothetical protein